MIAVPFLLDRPQIVHQVICNVMSAIVPTAGTTLLFNDTNYRGPAVASWMRQVAMYVLLRRFEMSVSTIARFCHRARPTVLHSAALVEKSLQTNELTAAFITFVEVQARTILADLEATETDTGRLPAEYESLGGFNG